MKEICFNQEVKTFICRIIFEKYFIKAIEDFFSRVYIASSKHSGSWENSRQDDVSGLQNFLEFSQLPLVFR